jgi:hypothetical protein
VQSQKKTVGTDTGAIHWGGEVGDFYFDFLFCMILYFLMEYFFTFTIQQKIFFNLE